MPRIEFDTDKDSYYCETSDVARWFRQYDEFHGGTSPTDVEVEALIEEWMEYIDRQTGHSWRENRVVEEMKDPDGSYDFWAGRPYNLTQRHVRDLDADAGDSLEEYTGGGWNDWLTDDGKSQGRGNDYWLDNAAGILYIDSLYWFRRHPQFRISYRYGDPNGATRAIRMATAKLVAADIAATDQYSMNIPGTDGQIDIMEASERWREDAERIIAERTETQYVEPF